MRKQFCWSEIQRDSVEDEAETEEVHEALRELSYEHVPKCLKYFEHYYD